MSNRKFKSGILTQLMEGGGNRGQREQYDVADDSSLRDKPSRSTRTSDADGHNIPETNLNVSTLLLS